MREYLISFFKDFKYEDCDAQELLCAYDKIVANEEAEQLARGAYYAYGANIKLDYGAEIFGRARQISKITGIHNYTVELLIFICLSKHLKQIYIEQGIDMQIFHDSMLDLKWKLEECKAVRGICGSFVAPWFPGFFDLTRFALGRLQFELVAIPFDYNKGGLNLKKGESRVINVHIPRTGTPMDKESCDSAYAQAREFFEGEVGENCPFVCHSWLLYPETKNFVPEHTNTYRFLSEYDVVEWDHNDGEDLWRLFDTDEKHPDRLPANTTLRRCFVEHLKRGGRVGWGCGIKL